MQGKPIRSRGTRSAQSAQKREGGRQFALHLPAWYRIDDEPEWHAGLTERISEHEVVIRAERPAEAIGPVTVVVPLPSTEVECGGCLVALGHIKETTTVLRGKGQAAFAIAVSESRLEPSERAFEDASSDAL